MGFANTAMGQTPAISLLCEGSDERTLFLVKLMNASSLIWGNKDHLSVGPSALEGLVDPEVRIWQKLRYPQCGAEPCKTGLCGKPMASPKGYALVHFLSKAQDGNVTTGARVSVSLFHSALFVSQ